MDQVNAAFKVGQTYSARSLCDYNTIWHFTVLKRTARFITLRQHNAPAKEIRVGVKTWDGDEYALPLGNYSMAPAIHADKP
jgi:hypothetical protein